MIWASEQAIWHFPEGDLVYLDGHDTEIQYDLRSLRLNER